MQFLGFTEAGMTLRDTDVKKSQKSSCISLKIGSIEHDKAHDEFNFTFNLMLNEMAVISII